MLEEVHVIFRYWVYYFSETIPLFLPFFLISHKGKIRPNLNVRLVEILKTKVYSYKLQILFTLHSQCVAKG